MKVQLASIAAIKSRNHEWLALHLEPNMREQPRIENGINQLGFMRSSRRQPAQLTAFCQSHRVPVYPLRSSSLPTFSRRPLKTPVRNGKTRPSYPTTHCAPAPSFR